MSRLVFLNSEKEELFADTNYGNKQDLTISIKSPNDISYPLDFNMFVDSVLAQKKLQKSLGNSLNIVITKDNYREINGVTFVSLSIKLEIGQGKLQKNILVPFICPIDIVSADNIIERINS